MKKSEVIELIREQVTENGNDPEEMFDAEEDSGADFRKLEAAGFKVEEIEREGGEDEGSRYHVVLKVTKQDEDPIFVKCDAYYQSYEGTDWSSGDTYEVKQVEKVIKDWKKVK